ncbi:Transmembrane protein 161A/B family-containing protein [Aphelenchoides fujianensis]|nr:Transmembrane protein 161A/B family-containing protein [Aphelenchoides fujianensis]
MALLGFHIVFSLIAATLFNKFQPQFTLCERLIYAGLTYYWIPEPPDANDARVRRRGRNRGDAAAPDYRRQLITLVLDKTIVSRMSYYPSLVWLVDYSFVAVLVFAACQLFIRFFRGYEHERLGPLDDLFILFRLLWKKFTNPHLSAERNLIFSFSFVIFLVFMLLNMFGEHFVDESLALGYRVLSERMKALAKEDASLDVRGGSPLFLFISASFATALLGAAFLMPVIQYSTLYRSTVDGQKTLWTAVHHSVFLLPLFILPLFIRTIQAQILLQVPGLTHELFVAIRLLLVVVWAVGPSGDRPAATANNARERAMGCSKHADGFDILRSHLSYVCATSLQLLAPPLAIFFLSLTLLSLGKIYPMNDARPAPNGAPDHFSVLLAPQVQRALWTNGLFTCLTLHTLMSMTTVAFGI